MVSSGALKSWVYLSHDSEDASRTQQRALAAHVGAHQQQRARPLPAQRHFVALPMLAAQHMNYSSAHEDGCLLEDLDRLLVQG